MTDFRQFTHLSFDCYGTLIDWETGILEAVAPVLAGYGVSASAEQVLRLHLKHEGDLEAGPYRPYREVLRAVMRRIAAELGFVPAAADLDVLAESLGGWPPFADTTAALARLKSRYRLVIISNIDDDLFAQTARVLQVPFDAVITAQRVRSYKPAPAHFHEALHRLAVPPRQILHVAQSLFHDHVPAKALGWRTVRVNRPSRLAGTGVAPPPAVQPDLEVRDLRGLVELLDAEPQFSLAQPSPGARVTNCTS
jgi:2-haloacid dehalogenase